MSVPTNLIANADDLGYNNTINSAILLCFQKGYINSTSLLTNTVYFDETIDLIDKNPIIKNIGIHVNITEGKPVSNFKQLTYLDECGNWDKQKTNKKTGFLNKYDSSAFLIEIDAQIEKALSKQIFIAHLDSHHHIHTLPCFYRLFLEVARRRNLKLRLAHINNESNYLKTLYRKYINQVIKSKNINYSDSFETVDQFLKNPIDSLKWGSIELMLHPDFDPSGNLRDHYDPDTLIDWVRFLEEQGN